MNARHLIDQCAHKKTLILQLQRPSLRCEDQEKEKKRCNGMYCRCKFTSWIARMVGKQQHVNFNIYSGDEFVGFALNFGLFRLVFVYMSWPIMLYIVGNACKCDCV